jgi:hypothetical protein
MIAVNFFLHMMYDDYCVWICKCMSKKNCNPTEGIFFSGYIYIWDDSSENILLIWEMRTINFFFVSSLVAWNSTLKVDN